MLAFAYTAPISALIHLCDREPAKTEEATGKIEAFSRHFIATYSFKETDIEKTPSFRMFAGNSPYAYQGEDGIVIPAGKNGNNRRGGSYGVCILG